jgi:hypothetical protein
MQPLVLVLAVVVVVVLLLGGRVPPTQERPARPVRTVPRVQQARQAGRAQRGLPRLASPPRAVQLLVAAVAGLAVGVVGRRTRRP